MKLNSALKNFELYLGVDEVPRTPRDGTASVLGFYTNVRIAGVDLNSNGDMLLFQWGTYDWGNGPMFEFDIARQLIGHGAEDDNIWQLHVTYRFAPSEALTSIGKGNRWCSHPDHVADLQRFIERHPAAAAVGTRNDGHVRVEYECAG